MEAMQRRLRYGLLLSLGLSFLALSAPSFGASDWNHHLSSVSTSIESGSAPIEKALMKIIPSPYAIEMDASIPRDWIVHWGAGSNWMAVLQRALAPMGLEAHPDWAHDLIRIVRSSSSWAASRSLQTSAQDSVSSPAESPILSGATNSQWDEPAPLPPQQPIALDSAVLRLLPPYLADVDLSMSAIDTNTPVTWRAGQTRRQALMQILRDQGLRAEVSPDMVELFKAPQAASFTNHSHAGMGMEHQSSSAKVDEIVLVAGKPLGEQLMAQARSHGWTLLWKVQKDWIVPSDTRFTGRFQSAVAQVIKAAAAEGAPLAATLYPVNRTIVVSQTEEASK